MRFNGNLKWFWDYKTENTEKCRILMREPRRRKKCREKKKRRMGKKRKRIRERRDKRKEEEKKKEWDENWKEGKWEKEIGKE